MRDLDAGGEQLRLAGGSTRALIKVRRCADEQGAAIRSAEAAGEYANARDDLRHDLAALEHPDHPAVQGISDPQCALSVERAPVRGNDQARQCVAQAPARQAVRRTSPSSCG